MEYSLETLEHELESIQLLYIDTTNGEFLIEEIAFLTQDEVDDVVYELSQIEFSGLKGGPHLYPSYAFKLIYPEKYIIFSMTRVLIDSSDNDSEFFDESSHLLSYSEELDLLLKKYGDIYDNKNS